MSEDIQVITLLGKPFQIKCPPDIAQGLQKTVDYVNEVMQTIKQTGSMNFEHILVTTTLNIAHELLTLKSNDTIDFAELDHRLETLKNKMAALSPVEA